MSETMAAQKAALQDAAGGVRETSAHRAIAAAGIGNMLEFYDFGIYAFVASIIARKFFPAEQEIAGLLLTFATLGVGFLVRPLGGIALGRVGDIAGRKTALVITIVLMAIGTVGIGLIPSYETIGILAPVLLVACRIIQGLSAGGERCNAIAFIVEWAPDGKRGFYGSFSEVSVGAGILLSTIAAASMNTIFSTAQIDAWAWRLPFLLGVIILPVGVWLRRDIDETPALRAERAGRHSDAAVLGSPLTQVLRAFGFSILWTIAFYVMLAYMPTFTQRHAGLSASQALWINAISLVVMIVAIPVMGALSDRIGRKPLLLFCCIALAVLVYPAFQIMVAGVPVWGIALIQIGFNLILAAFSGPGPAALSELFPTRSRTTLMSVGYSLANAIFGGFAPFIATWLIQQTGDPIAPTFYLIASGVISALCIASFRETGLERLR